MVVAASALAGRSVVAPAASAATPSGKKIARTVRALTERYQLQSTLFGCGAKRI
jgi:hypothetical protein